MVSTYASCAQVTAGPYFLIISSSIVLLAVIDANRKFITIDVGSYGKEGDAGIFMKSDLFKKIQNGQLKILPPTKLPEADIEMPYVFVGDDAFSLTNYMMKPYSKNHASQDRSKRIFNYRLSRARRNLKMLLAYYVNDFQISSCSNIFFTYCSKPSCRRQVGYVSLYHP